jgi:hypothetical protein
MYEEIINEIEAMGLDYVDNEDGTITVNIAELDKVDIVNAVSMLNDNMVEYDISEDSITIYVNPVTPEEPEMDEDEDVLGGMTDDALGDLGF